MTQTKDRYKSQLKEFVRSLLQDRYKELREKLGRVDDEAVLALVSQRFKPTSVREFVPQVVESLNELVNERKIVKVQKNYYPADENRTVIKGTQVR